ncbi:MAG: ester cyclase [Chloroflexota bacterium]|nr:ester cyclase [Chloroflexota bacterium]
MSIDANKALVRRWFAELDRGNIAAVEEFIAGDYHDHNPAIPDLPPGRDGVTQANLLLYAAFTDVTHEIKDQIAEGDKVMTRLVVRGKFTGEFLGFPPTGQVVAIEGAAVHRLADGKLVEHWAHVDMADFMRQIGAITLPPAPPTAQRD